MSSSVVTVPLTQSTMPVQKELVPTSAGMRSEASKRNTVSGFCRISIDCTPSCELASDGSRPWFAEMTPPSATRLLAHVSLAR